MLRDAVAVAALAVLTVQALRRWVGDRYLVPTGSMEPLLHGHPEHGDIVFVDKFASSSSLRPGNLVVVKSPSESGQQLVKRIAADGDDRQESWLNISHDGDGDLWRGADQQRMHRVVKDPIESRHQRVPWASTTGSAAAREHIDLRAAQTRTSAAGAATWHLPCLGRIADEARAAISPAARRARRGAGNGGVLPEGCVGTKKPVDAGYLDATGARGMVGNDVLVTDAGIDLELVELRGELLATIEARNEALTFHWQPAAGRIALWRDGVDDTAGTLPAIRAPQRIEFGLLDDRVFFVVDGRADAMFLAPRRATQAQERSHEVGAYTLVHIAVIGGDGDGLDCRRLSVFRDVFAVRDRILSLPGQAGPWPQHVPPGHWFLLGDSAFDSRDSRHFGAVPKSSFLGVPCCVLGPWPRTRLVRQ